MSKRISVQDPRVVPAVDELKALILEHFPSTRFTLGQGLGDDTEGIYLMAIVDIDDPDEVMDLVIDRLLFYQVDQALPLNLLPIRTPERIARDLAERERFGRAQLTPLW